MAASILLSDEESAQLKELLDFQLRGFEANKALHREMPPPEVTQCFVRYTNILRKLGVDVSAPVEVSDIRAAVAQPPDLFGVHMEMLNSRIADTPTRIERIATNIFTRIITDKYFEGFHDWKDAAQQSIDGAKLLIQALDDDARNIQPNL